MTKAIVVFDSRYGNTEKVARSIAEGLRKGGIADVLVTGMKLADEEDFKDRDIWVIGSPTRWGSASFKMKTLLTNAMKYEGKGKRAAVFDTRYHGMSRGASDKLSSMLVKYEISLIAEPTPFFVSSGAGPLEDGEEARAELFGTEIANRAK